MNQGSPVPTLINVYKHGLGFVFGSLYFSMYINRFIQIEHILSSLDLNNFEYRYNISIKKSDWHTYRRVAESLSIAMSKVTLIRVSLCDSPVQTTHTYHLSSMDQIAKVSCLAKSN